LFFPPNPNPNPPPTRQCPSAAGALGALGGGSGGGGAGMLDALKGVAADAAGGAMGAAGAGGQGGGPGGAAGGGGRDGAGAAAGAGIGGRGGRGGRDGTSGATHHGAGGGTATAGGMLHISLPTAGGVLDKGMTVRVNPNRGGAHARHHPDHHSHQQQHRGHRSRKRREAEREDEQERRDRAFRFGFRGSGAAHTRRSTTTSTTTSSTTTKTSSHHQGSTTSTDQSPELESERELVAAFNKERVRQGRAPIPDEQLGATSRSKSTHSTTTTTTSSLSKRHGAVGNLDGFDALPKLDFSSPEEAKANAVRAAERKEGVKRAAKAEEKEAKREAAQADKEVKDEEKAEEKAEAQMAGDAGLGPAKATKPLGGTAPSKLVMAGLTPPCFYCMQLVPLTAMGAGATGNWCSTMAEDKTTCAAVTAAVDKSFAAFAAMPGAMPQGFSSSVNTVCKTLCAATK
jgi:hypothetical protein